MQFGLQFTHFESHFRGLKTQMFEMGFKEQVFSNDNVITSMYITKTQICENGDVMRMCIA